MRTEKVDMNDLVMEEIKMEEMIEENEEYIVKCPRCKSEGELDNEINDRDTRCCYMSCKNCGLKWENLFYYINEPKYDETRWEE